MCGHHIRSTQLLCCRRDATGVSSYLGIDGVPGITSKLEQAAAPPGAHVDYANICDPLLKVPTHDWVLSLEVGEHLPNFCLSTYMALLDRSNRQGVILTWSQHTSGVCHVNSRGRTEVIQMMEFIGYGVDTRLSLRGMHRATYSWFKHNFLVYRRQTAIIE